MVPLSLIHILEALREEFFQRGEREKAHYLQLQIDILDHVLSLASRYQKLAEQRGNEAVSYPNLDVYKRQEQVDEAFIAGTRYIHTSMIECLSLIHI